MAPTPRRWLMILWPAFVMAGVLEALAFAMIDPADLQWFGAAPVQASRLAIYSIAFLVFWAAIATAGAVTAVLEVEER